MAQLDTLKRSRDLLKGTSHEMSDGDYEAKKLRVLTGFSLKNVEHETKMTLGRAVRYLPLFVNR